MSKRLGVHFVSAFRVSCAFTVVLSLGLTQSSKAFAWGELGHRQIAKIAVKVAQDRYKNPELSSVFLSNAESLAALSLVPDNQWKGGQPKEVIQTLSPAHFLDIEYLAPQKIDPKTIPFKINDAFELMVKLCPISGLNIKLNCEEKTSIDKILGASGSLPWRIGQMSELLIASFRQVKALQDKNASHQEIQTEVNRVILYSGILAHFVGDLTQPLHITKNYDGGFSDQKGVHSYFETKLINAQPHGFDRQAYDYAMSAKPAEAILSQAALATKRIDLNAWQPVESSFMLGLEANSQMNKVLDLDRKYAIIESRGEKDSENNRSLQGDFQFLSKKNSSGVDMAAARRSPDEIASKFNEILVQRIGIASDFLARIWHNAWVKAGSPNLSRYTTTAEKIGKIEPIMLDYSGFM